MPPSGMKLSCIASTAPPASVGHPASACDGSFLPRRWREVDSNLRSPVSGDTPQRPLITSPSRAGPSSKLS
jgi:hypothetical protein